MLYAWTLRWMGTLSGEVTQSFSYLLLSSRGFTLKGKDLLLSEQILSSKSRPHFGMAMSAKEANRKSQKLFLLVKWRLNMEVFPDTLIAYPLTFAARKQCLHLHCPLLCPRPCLTFSEGNFVAVGYVL